LTTASTGKIQKYYGYVLLAAAFLIMVMVFGGQYCFGVFFKPMINEFGWSRAATSGAFSVFAVVMGLMSILSGRISDKIGCRWVISIGSIVLGIGYMLSSRIVNLWQLYLLYGLIIAAGVSAMYVPIVSLITRWFPHRSGPMLGICISGIGLGTGVVPLIANRIVISHGWRDSIFILGSVSLVIILVLAQLLRQPEALNNEHNHITVPVNKEYSFFEALKTRQFWMVCLAWFCYGFFYQLGFIHIVPYAIDLGMSATAAALILTVIGLVGTPARVLLGMSGDKFGKRSTVILSFMLISLAYIGLATSKSVWMLYIFGVVFGFFNGVGLLLAPIAAEYFGMKSLGAVVGAIFFANNIGSSISPSLAGSIFDFTGSYFLAFLSCGVLGIAASIIIFLLKPALSTKKR